MLAPNALTTLDTIKTMLGIPSDDTSKDTLFELLINAASSYIESQTGRRFGLEKYNQRYQAPGQQELVLEQYPIRVAYHVKASKDGDPFDADSYDITKMGNVGVLWMDEGWPPRYYRGGLAFDPIYNSLYLIVRYLAGYVLPKDVDGFNPEDWELADGFVLPYDWILPQDLQLLCLEMIQSKWADIINGSFGLSSFSISDVSWGFDRSTRDSWTQTINAYKRW